jgi:CRP-like cAMP-binding protein
MVASSKEFSERFAFLNNYIQTDEVDELLKHVQVRNLDKDEVIIRDGEASSVLYFVWSGSLMSYLEDNDKTIEIGKIKSGEYLGEISFFDQGPATTSVKALEPCTLFVLSRDDFHELEKKQPDISGKLMRSISELIISRLRSSDRLLFDGLNSLDDDSGETEEPAKLSKWLAELYGSLHKH